MSSESRHTNPHDAGGSRVHSSLVAADSAASSSAATSAAGASTSATAAPASQSNDQHAAGETLGDDSVCEICFNGDIEDDNLIVFCDGTGADGNPCTAVVHQYCYGVFQIPEGDDPWYCDMCAVKQGVRKVSPKLMKTMDKCVLCPITTGAFKPLHDGSGWCHATCAVWIPETGFHDPKTMKDIIGVNAIERSRFRLICEFCHIREGACVQCLAHACRFSFHPICGFQHREQLKMDMEAVQIGQSFDVLKLVYCDRHKYLGDDAMEKKILIKKWKMNGKVDDLAGPDDVEEDEEEIIARRRRGGKGSRGPYKKRKKLRKLGGSDDEEEDQLRQEDASMQSSLSDDSDAQMRDLSSEDSGDAEGMYEVDEDGRKVRKTRAYMCADCGATKRRHNCPFAKERQEEKRKNKIAAKKERASKRRKGEAGATYPAGSSDSQAEQPIPNPFPGYHFVNTTSLARRRWRTETDSEVSSDDIHNDADLDMLADLLAKSEKAAEELERAEAERLAQYQPKLKSSPFSRRSSDGEPVTHGRVGRPRKHPIIEAAPTAGVSRVSSKTSAEMAAVAAATNLVTEAHYHSVEPSSLTPPMVNMLYNQVRALVDPTGLTANATANAAEIKSETAAKPEENNATPATAETKPEEKKEEAASSSADGSAVKPESASSSSGASPSSSSSSAAPVLLSTSESVSRVPVADNPVANFSFQFLIQPTTMQIFGAFAKTASELNAKSHPESIPAAMSPSVPPSLYFLSTLVTFQGALHAFVMQQRMSEIARIQSYNAQIEAARQAQLVRQKEKQEARLREREERVRERELEKQHKVQLKERDRLAKEAAKKSTASAMKGLQTSATFDALTASTAGGKRANATPKATGNMMGTSLQSAVGFVQLPPIEETDLKSRLIRFVAFNAAKDKLLHLQKELLDPSVDEMRQFGLRFLLEYRGVEVLRKWLETAMITVEGLMKLEKIKGGAVASTPSTPMLPQPAAAAGSNTSASTDGATASAENATKVENEASTNASAFAESTSTASATTAPALTPLLLNTDLALSCMRAMHRLSDLADFSRQPTFPQTVVLLTKLSSHENPSIKETAIALKAKLPTPVTIAAMPAVAPTQGPRALVTTKQQQQSAYAMGQGASPSAYALGLVGANPINANRMQVQPNMASMYGQAGMMQGMQGSMMMNPSLRPTPHAGMMSGAVPANAARMPQPGGPVPHQFNRGPPQALAIHQPPQQQQRGPGAPYNRPPPQQGGRDMYGHMGPQQPSPQAGYYGAQPPQGRPFGNQPMYDDQQPYGDQNNYYGGQQQQPRQQYPPHQQRPQPPQFQQQQPGGGFYGQQQPQQQQPRGYTPPSDDYFNDVVNNPQAGNTPSPTGVSGSGAPLPNALSALTAMLNTGGGQNNGVDNSNPAPAAVGGGGGNVDVAQLSQWLNTKLDNNSGSGAPSASAPNNPGAQLTALLAKVQQQQGGVAAGPTNPQPASNIPLDQQLADLQVHVRHWDDQYNVLWHRHNAALLAIQSIQNSSNVMEKLQRMGELQQHEQSAHDLAAQLRNVQANQASIAARVQAVEQAIMMQQQQQQPQRPPPPQAYQAAVPAYPPQQQQQQQPLQSQPYPLPTPPMPPMPPQPPQQQQAPSVAAVAGGDPRKILVTGLAAGTSESSLRQLFAHFGTLVSATLVIDPKTGQSSCTAYLTYVSADQAANIIKIGMRNPYKLDGRDLKLVPAPPS